MNLKNAVLILIGILFIFGGCRDGVKHPKDTSVLVKSSEKKLDEKKNKGITSKEISLEKPKNNHLSKGHLILKDSLPPKNNAERDRNILVKSTFTKEEKTKINSIPYRLLHYNLQRKMKANIHHFGSMKLKIKLGGHYQGKIPNSNVGVYEYFTNVLQYGNRVEYYNTNQLLQNTYKFNDYIPLESKYHKKIIQPRDIPREFISETNTYEDLPNFLDNAKYILVTTRSESFMTSPIVMVTYHIDGFNDEYERIGYKCVIKLINEKGIMDFQQEFDKRVFGKIIDESGKFLFLGLNYGITGNKESIQGNYFVFDIDSGEKLFEYFPNLEKEENYGGPISEYQRNFIQFGISLKKEITKEYYNAHGLFDISKREFFKVIYSEEDYLRLKKEDPAFWRNLPVVDWKFIRKF